MTTNINLFDLVNNSELTVDKFSKVCVKMNEGMALYRQTERIYEFLKAHRGNEFTCTEHSTGICGQHDDPVYRMLYHIHDPPY